MIDIIISAYNAHKTIVKTLLSIEMQTMVDDINVYIIDDASQKDYEDIKNMFKDTLRIKIIKNSKNLGPGLSRQKALDNSNSEYIVFIDADDVFYDIYAIENLYKNIDGYDSAWGIVLEQENEDEFTYARGKDIYLHGKIYRRSIIEKNDIKFCNSRNHEDNAFNVLYKSCCKNINIFDNLVYVYTQNETSITNNTSNRQNIHSFIEVYYWLINEEIKKKVDKKAIAVHIYVVILYVYFNYFLYKDDENLEFVFQEMKKIKKLYEEYDILDEYTKICIFNNICFEVIPSMTVEDFLSSIE